MVFHGVSAGVGMSLSVGRRSLAVSICASVSWSLLPVSCGDCVGVFLCFGVSSLGDAVVHTVVCVVELFRCVIKCLLVRSVASFVPVCDVFLKSMSQGVIVSSSRSQSLSLSCCCWVVCFDSCRGLSCVGFSKASSSSTYIVIVF